MNINNNEHSLIVKKLTKLKGKVFIWPVTSAIHNDKKYHSIAFYKPISRIIKKNGK